MCTARRHCIAIFACLLAAPAAAQLWVITDSAHPVTGTRTPDRYIALDAAQRIDDELSSDLPSDPQQAEALVRKRLTGAGAELSRRLQAAYQDVADAWALGITHLPAVVMDQRFVVYGQANLDQAVAAIGRGRVAP